MLKSSEYRQGILDARPGRIDEEALDKFLVVIDAWADGNKDAEVLIGTEAQKKNFIKLVIALGDDDDLIDEEEAKILARALPRACYKPITLKGLATSQTATYLYVMAATAIVLVIVAYFAGMFLGKASENAAHLNKDLLAVEEANRQLQEISGRLTAAEAKLQKATEQHAAEKEGLNKKLSQTQQKVDELSTYASNAHKFNETLLDALTSYRNAALADDAKERTRLRNEGDEKRLKLNELKP